MRGLEQDRLRVGAQDQLAHRAAPTDPDDDEVRLQLVGGLQDVVDRVLAAHEVAQVVLHVRRVQQGVDAVQGLGALQRGRAVELLTVVGVDDDDHAPAQLGLGDSLPDGCLTLGAGDIPDHDSTHLTYLPGVLVRPP